MDKSSFHEHLGKKIIHTDPTSGHSFNGTLVEIAKDIKTGENLDQGVMKETASPSTYIVSSETCESDEPVQPEQIQPAGVNLTDLKPGEEPDIKFTVAGRVRLRVTETEFFVDEVKTADDQEIYHAIRAAFNLPDLRKPEVDPNQQTLTEPTNDGSPAGDNH